MSKWIKCKNCQHEYSNKLSRCPSCSKLTPFTFSKICGIILVITIMSIAIVGIFVEFLEKDYTNSDSNQISSNNNLIESKENFSSKTESSKENNSNSTTESNNDKHNNNSFTASSGTNENSSPTTTNSTEQKPTILIPQDEINGVKTSEIILPTPFDATDALNQLRGQYAPLKFTFLTYAMDDFAYKYNKQYEGTYNMNIGGYKDKIMLYTYKIQYDFADVTGAKSKFDKFIDDNTNFFNFQLELYKKYVPEITGLCILFEHDKSNQTLTSRTFN